MRSLWIPLVAFPLGLILCSVPLPASGQDAASPDSQNQPSTDRRELNPQTQQPADVQDIIFLGDSRPLLIRLRVKVSGQPFRQVWRDYITRVFDDADRDKDGVLNKEEAARAPDLTTGNFGVRVGGRPVSPLAQVADSEGKVSRESFLGFQEKSRAAPFSTRQGQGRVQSAAALFSLLDTDHDRQLSADELRGAETALRKRDFDDDEIITDLELVPGQNSFASGAVVFTAGGQPAQPGSNLVLVVTPATAPAELAAALTRRYDTNKDGRLSSGQADSREVVLAAELLAKLDANADRLLDAKELGQFATREPDIELRFTLGTETTSEVEEAIQSADTGPSGYSVKRRSNGNYMVDVGDAQLEVIRNPANPSRNNPQAGQAQFRFFDPDNNGYIDEQEGRMRGLTSAFGAMDRDGDGKVFREEFNAYYDRLNEAAATRLSLEVTDQGQQLLEMLDGNRDGRLTLRELRGAPELLAKRDVNHDGKLGGNEIPRSIRMELSRSANSANPTGRVLVASNLRQSALTRPAPVSGPLWFRKMDRNQDGDVSPREFLGSRDDFDQLDVDSDGLINAQEAVKAGTK